MNPYPQALRTPLDVAVIFATCLVLALFIVAAFRADWRGAGLLVGFGLALAALAAGVYLAGKVML